MSRTDRALGALLAWFAVTSMVAPLTLATVSIFV